MTARVVRLTLPEPPSANRWWRKWNNRMVKSKEAREYMKAMWVRLGNQVIVPFRADVPIRFEIVWRRKRKSGDLDKRIGIILDALQGIVYANDAQIVQLVAERRDDKSGEIDVTVSEAGAPMLSALGQALLKPLPLTADSGTANHLTDHRPLPWRCDDCGQGYPCECRIERSLAQSDGLSTDAAFAAARNERIPVAKKRRAK